MIKIYINRMFGEKGKYFMKLINEDTMRDDLVFHFDCVHCISAMINTLTWATLEEIDLTNYAWEDWEKDTTCRKKPGPNAYVEYGGN